MNKQHVNIGSHRELFVDEKLIDRFDGDIRLKMHRPRREEVVMEHKEVWEGNTSAYSTILHETGNNYRMYYRGWHMKPGPRASKPAHEAVFCLALSEDGINWRKPNLGLIEYAGSKDNNIVWAGEGADAFVPMLDNNPDAAANAKYKAVANAKDKRGRRLMAFQSQDGLSWEKMHEEPILTHKSVSPRAFDSQNLAFYDAERGEYRIYFRDWVDGKIREIKTATSSNFLDWSEPEFIDYEPAVERCELYTNAVQPYHRAPHFFVGFPARYMHKREEMLEPLFMTSRDGRTFRRWEEALIRPGRNADKWHNRSNYVWVGMTETAAPLPGNDTELSIYTNESYFKGDSSRIRRYTYRLDGFVSLHAGAQGGEVVTKAFIFEGERLHLNYSTAVAGHIRLEIQDADGTPIEGFKLEDMEPVYGDGLAQEFTWKGRHDLSVFCGRPVRLRFELKDADVFAMQFV